MSYKHYYKDDLKKILILYGFSFIIIIVVLFYSFLQIYTKHTVSDKNIMNIHIICCMMKLNLMRIKFFTLNIMILFQIIF